MKSCKRLLGILIVLVLSVVTLCVPAAIAEGETWTILIYLCGSDLESDDGYATDDLMEIMNTPYSEDIHIVIETGGSFEWKNNFIDANTNTRLFHVEGDYQYADIRPASNMGDPETLSDFISWGVENYPADHYGLILWDHGSGSIAGVCYDDRFNEDSLSLTEISMALEQTKSLLPNGFEFIGFDACLMATLETANVLVPYARYMYASEEVEPGTGWDYPTLMTWLAEHPDADGAALGQVQCDSYITYSQRYRERPSITFSIIDLSKIPALVEAFDTTAGEMRDTTDITHLIRAIVKTDRFGTNNRTTGRYANMIDMKGLLLLVEPFAPSATEAIAALEDAVIYNGNGAQHADAGGLSMYYPLKLQGSMELPIFADVCASPAYGEFITALADGEFIGTTFVDGGRGSGAFGTIYNSTTQNGTFAVQLESTENLAYATCVLTYINEDAGESVYLGEDDDIIINDETATLYDNFDGTWAKMNGYTLPMEPVTVNDQALSIYTVPAVVNGERTNLRIAYDWRTETFELLGTWEGIDEENGYANRIGEDLKDGDVINLVYCHYFDDDSNEEYLSSDIIVDDDLRISYEPLPAGRYRYRMCLYDLTGNYYVTDAMNFDVHEDGSVTFKK